MTQGMRPLVVFLAVLCFLLLECDSTELRKVPGSRSRDNSPISLKPLKRMMKSITERLSAFKKQPEQLSAIKKQQLDSLAEIAKELSKKENALAGDQIKEGYRTVSVLKARQKADSDVNSPDASDDELQLALTDVDSSITAACEILLEAELEIMADKGRRRRSRSSSQRRRIRSRSPQRTESPIIDDESGTELPIIDVSKLRMTEWMRVHYNVGELQTVNYPAFLFSKSDSVSGAFNVAFHIVVAVINQLNKDVIKSATDKIADKFKKLAEVTRNCGGSQVIDCRPMRSILHLGGVHEEKGDELHDASEVAQGVLQHLFKENAGLIFEGEALPADPPLVLVNFDNPSGDFPPKHRHFGEVGYTLVGFASFSSIPVGGKAYREGGHTVAVLEVKGIGKVVCDELRCYPARIVEKKVWKYTNFLGSERAINHPEVSFYVRGRF